MEGFKFELGQLVTLRVVLAEVEAYIVAGAKATLQCGCVVGRMADECSAGVQRSYQISTTSGVGKHHESELVSWVSPEVAALLDKIRDSRKPRDYRNDIDAAVAKATKPKD